MKEKPIKRVAAIHDLSGFGKASLNVVIPILSSMKIQVCPVPTAILSTHTGGFENYTFLDLTDYMKEYINHWKTLDISFDAIYSGFLGSEKQIDIVSDFIDYFSKNNESLVVVDPVMGDDGVLYPTITADLVNQMRKLISKSEVITPNFTEACFLLGEHYREYVNLDILKKWLKALSKSGPKIVIITSVPEKDSTRTGVVAYNSYDDRYWKVTNRHIRALYPGTGDAFTSVIVGSLLNGDSLSIAIDKATQFVIMSLKASYGYNYPKREGILLEKVLDTLNMPTTLQSYEI
ncbi:MAG: pyridoxamine kinase [Defluviitoga tunisiensis]|nr:pyridoxamine kinase [Defluviitoga tunisiensis]HOP25262.1 pyridoxamine kinase [Defluviitoga sp.]MDY0380202.1 pyridoxamine kinase [Defluviitoga tunisiensis]HHV00849.1 pyridoxamine kinase [Defluviitoga tunisiensis]HOB55381.1 pyridoxamine kinase [Defluviitoga tunisiensis]